MKEITLCGYYGMCDSKGNSVGHSAKVAKEYAQLLEENYKVSIIASPCIINQVKENSYEIIQELPYNILTDVPHTLYKRILDKYKIMRNAALCLKKSTTEKLFFYHVDFFFFFYLYLFYHPKRSKKQIYCLIYHQEFTGGAVEKILQRIYKRALEKIDGVIYTQHGNRIDHRKTMWIPDYAYNEAYYSTFVSCEKKEKVICLGTMNRYKEIDKLVNVFSNMNYVLEIVGRFEDEEKFQQLLKTKTSNITIRNEVITMEEYYKLLGEAKFSILPYDMNQYSNRTSGVLLETIFLGSIPIAPSMLIEQNELYGMGYKDLTEISSIDLNAIGANAYDEERNKILNEYGLDVISQNMSEFFV